MAKTRNKVSITNFHCNTPKNLTGTLKINLKFPLSKQNELIPSH